MFEKKEAKNEEGQVGEDKKKLFLKKASVFVVHYFDSLVAVTVLIIFVTGFFFIINPKYKTINEMEMYSIDDLEAGKTKLENYSAKLVDYRNTYRDLSEVGKERIEKVVPGNEQLENFFAQIESITKKQGVFITSMSVADEKKKEKVANSGNDEGVEKETANSAESKGELGVASISLIISGVDYAGTKKLLSIFENNLRLMDVKSIKFDTSNKEVELLITAYFLR